MRTLLEAALRLVNILYVEDNADVRNLVLDLMEGEGRRVVACADAETAWGHLQRGGFDVLVTDMNLPGTSGSDLARRWLKDDAARHVILYSGFDFRSHLASMASMGSNVRAVPKEDFEQLDQVLASIGDQLQHRCANGG